MIIEWWNVVCSLGRVNKNEESISNLKIDIQNIESNNKNSKD